MFFINIPRDFWFSKPLPIGFWSVDIMFDRYEIAKSLPSEFSISIGFVGEQMLMLGDQFYLGLIFLILNIIILRKLVLYFSSNYIVPLLIFDLNLVSYYWEEWHFLVQDYGLC